MEEFFASRQSLSLGNPGDAWEHWGLAGRALGFRAFRVQGLGFRA